MLWGIEGFRVWVGFNTPHSSKDFCSQCSEGLKGLECLKGLIVLWEIEGFGVFVGFDTPSPLRNFAQGLWKDWRLWTFYRVWHQLPSYLGNLLCVARDWRVWIVYRVTHALRSKEISHSLSRDWRVWSFCMVWHPSPLLQGNLFKVFGGIEGFGVFVVVDNPSHVRKLTQSVSRD